MSRYSVAVLEESFLRFANWKLLGEGGEGAVFAVWDRIRKSEVALKLMRDRGEPDLGDRVLHEYGLLASSRSSRLVTVHDLGHEVVPVEGRPCSHYWYTMERCESSVRLSFRRMPLAQRVEIALQMLDGIAFLHAKRIAHRDIKPDNLFLVKGAQIKIGDFGLSTTYQSAPRAARGAIFGSPAYLAPERWTGQPEMDFRPSDQYAAGVTIFELLSRGDMPLDVGRTRQTCFEAHLYGFLAPLRIPELGGRDLGTVDRVLGRMLAKETEARYPDIAQCKRELSAALAQDDVASEPEPPQRRAGALGRFY